MSEPLVSVILPVFNGQAFIDETLRSVVAQTYTKLDIVVVDDGSTDATLSIVSQWVKADPRFRISSFV